MASHLLPHPQNRHLPKVSLLSSHGNAPLEAGLAAHLHIRLRHSSVLLKEAKGVVVAAVRAADRAAAAAGASGGRQQACTVMSPVIICNSPHLLISSQRRSEHVLTHRARSCGVVLAEGPAGSCKRHVDGVWRSPVDLQCALCSCLACFKRAPAGLPAHSHELEAPFRSPLSPHRERGALEIGH